MVAREDVYYGTVFQGARGVTQGYLLSPIIFNVVMDAVMCNWLTLVIVGSKERGKHVQEGSDQAAF